MCSTGRYRRGYSDGPARVYSTLLANEPPLKYGWARTSCCGGGTPNRSGSNSLTFAWLDLGEFWVSKWINDNKCRKRQFVDDSPDPLSHHWPPPLGESLGWNVVCQRPCIFNFFLSMMDRDDRYIIRLLVYWALSDNTLLFEHSNITYHHEASIVLSKIRNLFIGIYFSANIN